MSTRTPNYVLSVVVILRYSPTDEKVLEAGTFVRPVELQYVPEHVIQDKRWKWFDKDTDVFVYTRLGFIAVHRKNLREV